MITANLEEVLVRVWKHALVEQSAGTGLLKRGKVARPLALN